VSTDITCWNTAQRVVFPNTKVCVSVQRKGPELVVSNVHAGSLVQQVGTLEKHSGSVGEADFGCLVFATSLQQKARLGRRRLI
jgi:hypothetical protein